MSRHFLPTIEPFCGPVKFRRHIRLPRPLLRITDRFRHYRLNRIARDGNENPDAAGINAFRPRGSNAAQLGFFERDHSSRFAEACSALNVRQVSDPNTGYGTRSYGAKVIDQSGATAWLKVFGLISESNERWKAETEADTITEVPKPTLLRQISWRHADEFWVARLTTFVAGIVEPGPWADVAADGVEMSWLKSLSTSLEILAQQPCSRIHIQTRIFERWLKRHFRHPPTITSADWVPSHNDLQWSNLSHPDLSLLDWEWYGRSPRGYDQGTLIAYSCHNAELAARLEREFHAVFETDIGIYGKLFAAHTVRNAIRNGWLTPAMTRPVERLIERWEAPIR
jgi:hypothetical protein